MSLIASAKTETNYTPIPEGTYLAVCNMLIDLGEQVNKKYDSIARKVLIGWEIPNETITIDGEEKPRIISKQYTNSLGKKASLRADLISWRGRDFTDEELAAFDLKNIVGASCLINIVHNESGDRVYANISGIMALPKGMPKGQLSEPPTVFDLDVDPLESVEKLPAWIAEKVKSSVTFLDKQAALARQEAGTDATGVVLEEITDDLGEQLPF